MAILKGISWDHPRGYQPLRATADLWRQQTGVRIKWDVRTLKEFGDLSVEELAKRYDLIIIDHPYMGEADANSLLVPLNQYLPADFLAAQEKQSVGPSWNSYQYNGCLYALPVDAAAQVSAFRKDLAESAGWILPSGTMKLKDAAALLPDRFHMAVPLCPTDSWCVFLSLCAQYSDGAFFSGSGIEAEPGKWALEQVREWGAFIHKDSYSMNPVQMLEHMASQDEIIYSPFMFGYTNYSRRGFAKKPVHFCNVPQYRPGGVSSLLGGAGIAVSAATKDINACLAFIQYILDPAIQRTVYYSSGGQPAHLAAWEDEQCNTDCADFFSATLDTMKHAYVRPTKPGFNRFQEQAADLMHRWIRDRSDEGKAVNKLNNLYHKFCNEKQLQHHIAR